MTPRPASTGASQVALSCDPVLLELALLLAQRIATRPPAASAYAKEAACDGMEIPLDAGLVLEKSLFALLMSTADRAEAATAFREKRPPRFVGH